MNAVDLTKKAISDLETAKAVYAKDLEALAEDQLQVSPGGSARAPYDFTYEVVIVNQRTARRIRGEDAGPWPFESWAVAPDDFKSKAVAQAAIESSIQEVIDALQGEATKVVPTPQGEKTRFELASFAAMHTMYHDAQLNYLQALLGDAEMHW